jgi:sugar phosphate isomerase/epimerase
MYFTGFADEAAKDIDGQIRATKEIGWSQIEARNIDGVNIHDLPEEKFEEIARKLKDAGVQVNCFGSAIANWSKSIEDPFEPTLAEVNRAIDRMNRLGTKLIRVMSFAVLENRAPEDQMKEERFERLRKICSLFKENGLQPVHENCMNYGGMGYPYTLELVENVPGLKLVFDTGNPLFSSDRSKPQPWPMQNSLEFYQKVKEHVAYIHIKDGVFENDQRKFTFPGEGKGHVKEILTDLINRGYDGGISIEPHMAVVLHEKDKKAEEEQMFANYVEYGRRIEAMVEDIRKGS